MRVLIARNDRGFLHAVTCDHPAGFGDRFRVTMAAQACTVEDLSMDEYSRLRTLGYVPRAKGSAPAAAEAARSNPVEFDQIAAPDPTDLPEPGQQVRTDVFPRATVTGVLTWPDGTRAAHVRAPGGAGLARPGGWRPLDAPPPIPALTPAPPPPQARASPPPDLTAPPALTPTRMPSLFGDWS